ncbi:sirohydrochlorin chelatase [Pararobbsia silviterrae]|uniref:Cobalamin biosynthesis protein CbiX n=1 Tax=Pararobbsia silviterrae TaxID=1792498 RepID=A0A494Y332_9BURK|nr:CbiX/SirB N-terminal domain-containing protein [Pararobbsia silviterrae]RKP56709.1 cobalamin biosynthesis protein CbiX [Pararobbsia silviterrae]
MTHGLILFGHGARDARWKAPFERLQRMLATMHTGPVSLAFLELMSPDLPSAVDAHVAQGCARVTVIPVFFGQGGHVRRDLPDIVAQCQARHPGIEIRCATAVGEDEGVLAAIAAYCVTQAAQ